MPLADGQFAFRGVTFGLGTALLVTEVVGLDGMEVRSSDQLLPRGHGAVPGAHFVAPKQPVLTFATVGGTQALDVLSQTLADTFSVQDAALPLTWKREGQAERLMFVRPLQVALPRDRPGLRRPKVALAAADPRIYSAAEHTVNLPLYSASGGGAEYPSEFPVDFSAGASTDVVLSNAGAADAHPLLRFYGPTDGGTVTQVKVTNLTTGEAQTVTTSIGAGQILTVDNLAYVTGSGAQVVGLDGASRYGSWEQPRLPLRLPPGDSVLRFTTTGTSTAVAATAAWRDTWLS